MQNHQRYWKKVRSRMSEEEDVMRKCAVCGRQLERYVPIEQKYRKQSRPETLNRQEYSCPYCYAADRDRLIVTFLKRLKEKAESRFDLLEIAPSGALQRYLNFHWGGVNLYTADLYMQDVNYKMDIQNMEQFSDGAFDMIVCSHVLEHVCSDRQAMKELYRVLDSRGLAVILVPIDLDQKQIDEEWGLSEEENERRFGQKDHVRRYSRQGFAGRLKEAGFTVFLLDESYFTYQEFRENAFTQTSTLYVVCKDAGLYTCRENLAGRFASLHQPVPIEQEFLLPSGACNYWLDVCEVTEAKLYLWGWVYIANYCSRESKLKVMLKNDTRQYIFGTEFRKREDIQEKYGRDGYGQEKYDYLHTGLDCTLPLCGLEEGTYGVWLLICNRQVKYRIDLAKKVFVQHQINGGRHGVSKYNYAVL